MTTIQTLQIHFCRPNSIKTISYSIIFVTKILKFSLVNQKLHFKKYDHKSEGINIKIPYDKQEILLELHKAPSQNLSLQNYSAV